MTFVKAPPGDLPLANQNQSEKAKNEIDKDQQNPDSQNNGDNDDVSSLSNTGNNTNDNENELCARAWQSMIRAQRRQSLWKKVKSHHKPSSSQIPEKEHRLDRDNEMAPEPANSTKPPPSLRPARYSPGPAAKGLKDQMDNFLSTVMTRQVISHNRISQITQEHGSLWHPIP